MVEVLIGIFETQLAWILSPLGIGIALGGALLIGSGLLGRIVLVVNRELQIRSSRQRHLAAAPNTASRSDLGRSRRAA